MNRVCQCACCLAVVALIAAGGIVTHSQTPVSGTKRIVDNIAPPAIESGTRPYLWRAPDSEDTRRRATLRSASAPLEKKDSAGRSYLAGRVIVKFRDGLSDADRTRAIAAVEPSGSMMARPSYADFDLIAIDMGADAEAVARALGQRPEVVYAQPSYRMHPKFKPNDRFYGDQWNLPIIGMESAWDIQPAAGSSITVAVLDSGVAYTNTTLRFRAGAFTMDDEGRIGPPGGRGTAYPALGTLTLSFVAATELGPSTRFVAPYDFIWDDNVPVDLDGHGTHVAGTIGQLTNNASNGVGDARNGGGTAGIAFNVKIMPVKVINTEWDDIFGSPHRASDDVVAQGIRYAADNGAKVINMSFGDIGSTSPVMESAMRYAAGKGVFMAIAAGNEFESGNPLEVPAAIASRLAGAVSVGAIDRSKARAYYSNTGNWIELVAPGGSFRGFDNTGGVLQQTLDLVLVDTFMNRPQEFTAPRFDALAYYYFNGTSMATPHVSGVAAMLMQQGITDPAAVEAALEKFAVDLGPPGRDDSFGFGLVDARAVLRGMGIAR